MERTQALVSAKAQLDAGIEQYLSLIHIYREKQTSIAGWAMY